MKNFFYLFFFIFYLNEKANDFRIKIFKYRSLSEKKKEDPNNFFESLNEEGKRHAYKTLSLYKDKEIDLKEFIKNFKNQQDIYNNIEKIIQFNELIKNNFENS